MNCLRYFVFTIPVALSFCSLLVAQSNFDLSPPMQAETKSDQVLMSPDPSAMPTFNFAVAELNDEGQFVISTSAVTQVLKASEAAGPDLSKGIPYTEMVEEKHTVMVPSTENVDGKVVTKMKPVERTRKVKVTKYRKRNAEEQAEYEKELELDKDENGEPTSYPPAEPVAVEIPFTMTIPFNETLSDGTKVMRTKTMTKMRIAQVMRGATETTALVKTSAYAPEKIKFFTVTGEPVASTEVVEMLDEKRPVILINHQKAIAPYFEAILKPGTLFVVCEDK